MQHIIPMDLINAILVAECFIKHVFKLYRLPNIIVSPTGKGTGRKGRGQARKAYWYKSAL